MGYNSSWVFAETLRKFILDQMARDNNKAPGDAINDAVHVLERRDLDLSHAIDVSGYAASGSSRPWGGDQFEFLRIKAISRSLPEKKSDVERYMMEDVLSGLHGLKVPFIYLIIGSRLMVNVYLGVLNKSISKPSPSYHRDVLRSSLQGTFPDIEVEPLSKDDVDKRIIQFFHRCRHYGILTGVPTAKLGVENQGIEQIERLIRGLYRQDYGYMVISDPVSEAGVIDAFDDIADLIKDNSSFIKESRQYTRTSRLSLSGETFNRSVQYYIELLEILLEKLKLSKAQGMWRVMTYFFSPNPATVGKMSNLLKTVFSGDKSSPEAIRTLILNDNHPSAILSKFRQIELELNSHPLSWYISWIHLSRTYGMGAYMTKPALKTALRLSMWVWSFTPLITSKGLSLKGEVISSPRVKTCRSLSPSIFIKERYSDLAGSTTKNGVFDAPFHN